jgi:hypothetical protein
MILLNNIVKNISQIIKIKAKSNDYHHICQKTIRLSKAPAYFCQVKSGYALFA